MSRVNIEIELPDTLATQAKKAGLLALVSRTSRTTDVCAVGVDLGLDLVGRHRRERPQERELTATRIFEGYAALTTVVVPAIIPPVIIEDPDDDAVLACAVAAKVDLVVSGDPHLVRLEQYEGIPIVTPPCPVRRAALDQLRSVDGSCGTPTRQRNRRKWLRDVKGSCNKQAGRKKSSLRSESSSVISFSRRFGVTGREDCVTAVPVAFFRTKATSVYSGIDTKCGECVV